MLILLRIPITFPNAVVKAVVCERWSAGDADAGMQGMWLQECMEGERWNAWEVKAGEQEMWMLGEFFLEEFPDCLVYSSRILIMEYTAIEL